LSGPRIIAANAARRRRALRDAIDRQGEARMTDTGFAIGELILAAAEAAPMLCVGVREHRAVGARLVRALEGVGVDRARLSIIPETEMLKTAVPLVMYFRNQEEADQFTGLVRNALEGSKTHG
jgi:hypothetical protein